MDPFGLLDIQHAVYACACNAEHEVARLVKCGFRFVQRAVHVRTKAHKLHLCGETCNVA